MDMTTLKTMIIELKDSGMSFQEISDYLCVEHGINKSRQALNGLYNRAKKAVGKNEERQKITCDVVNLYCLLDTVSMVSREAHRIDLDITYSQVLNIIKGEEAYVSSVESTIIASIVSKIGSIYDIRELRKSINYKGIVISDKKLSKYFEKAYTIYIKQKIEEHLSTIYKLTSNKDMAKRVGKNFNMNITTADLKHVN